MRGRRGELPVPGFPDLETFEGEALVEDFFAVAHAHHFVEVGGGGVGAIVCGVGVQIVGLVVKDSDVGVACLG